MTENLTQRQLHEAHCGPFRGNFKVCYCNQPCCKVKDAHGNLRCICHHGCRAEAACQSRSAEIAVSIGVDTCTCPWNEKEAPTWTDSAASSST